MYNYNDYNTFGYNNNNGNRFFDGGFFTPFLLGGITGGLIASNRPNYQSYPAYYPYYQPYPYYYSENNQYYY